MHVYRKTKETETGSFSNWIYTVGYYEPHTLMGEGGITEYRWISLEDTSNEAEARQLVNYLNGGEGLPFRYVGKSG
jgi:hypothetical protein